MNKDAVLIDVRRSLEKINIKWVVAFITLSACVDRINFNIPTAQPLMVVEGTISDDPGPYTVKISRSLSLTADSSFRDPVRNVKIKLYDDEGHAEDLTETSPGVYVTGGVIQGKVGHAYYINMQTSDGKIFLSDPDTINPVGEVEEIRYEFEAKTIHENYGEIDANVFNIFIDADAGVQNNNYVRWRYTGTYEVQTHPDLHLTWADGYWEKTPLPCSGYIVTPSLGGGSLTQVGPCTCCTCWVNQFESEPHLSDEQLIINHQFRNVKVGEVPVNTNTFMIGYMVEVEQMSLTRRSFDFFNLIRSQKEGASSLFQPPSGQIIGNIKAVNSSINALGLFWATSIKSKYIPINRSDVPYPIPPDDFIRDTCLIYPNSSTNKPDFWQ